ncbi:MucR family transcriptional regulator [Aminobacter aminovorans]|uniref:MucR family transcriptional regulator n=1 Tax=Aminobacter aminovorans TaxID=83263 RepID=UPI0028615FF8|nr:MucR family transcriptional regulator [Aminobacter aminovorans]MDR7221300.1 putative transcriptional regulator [Aminobacter aminovorans]
MSDQIAEAALLLPLTADIVAAYVSNNPVPAAELAALINQVHQSVQTLAAGSSIEPAGPTEVQKPAVSIKKSVTPDYLISLEDGQKYKSIKRHLMSKYGMTPADYRAKWGLPNDYPMVAPNYSAVRSELAKKLGLGRKPAKGKKAPAKASRTTMGK